MVEIIEVQTNNLTSLLQGLSHWRVPASVHREMRRFIDESAMGKVNKEKRISTRRLCKYFGMLRVPLVFLNKPTARITGKDIEKFEKALASDQIKSRLKNKPYAHATKADFRKGLKIFLAWRLGKAAAIKLAGWLDTRDKPKTPDFLKEQEIEQLHRKCRTAEHDSLSPSFSIRERGRKSS